MITAADKQFLMVGFKQTLKAINEDKADRVYLAQSCDDKIRIAVEEAANDTMVSLMYIASMKELGTMCGINVGASCAVVLKH